MTSKPSTHYDNLQVPRDAPPDVIRSAYKQLARRCHPDRNANSVESHRLMQSLNASFEVLDDPRRRAEHDRWIAAQERSVLRPIRTWLQGISGKLRREGTQRPFREHEQSRWGDIFSGWIAPACVVAFLLWGFSTFRHSGGHSAASSSAASAAKATPPAATIVYRRPETAPNGKPWPFGPAELAGLPTDLTDGKSEVTVDNSRNDTDVYAKLVSVAGDVANPVRHLYIPAHRSLQCSHVRPGAYEVWYEDLSTGAVKHSEPFTLMETRDERVANYSVMRIVLYRMSEGLGSSQRVAGEIY